MVAEAVAPRVPFIVPAGTRDDPHILGPLLVVDIDGEVGRGTHAPQERGADKGEKKFGKRYPYFAVEFEVVVRQETTQVAGNVFVGGSEPGIERLRPVKDVPVFVGETERKAEISGRVGALDFCRYQLGFSFGEENVAVDLRCLSAPNGSKLYVDIFQYFQPGKCRIGVVDHAG